MKSEECGKLQEAENNPLWGRKINYLKCHMKEIMFKDPAVSTATSFYST